MKTFEVYFSYIGQSWKLETLDTRLNLPNTSKKIEKQLTKICGMEGLDLEKILQVIESSSTP